MLSIIARFQAGGHASGNSRVPRHATRFRINEADDELLCDGFHAFEAANLIRWTNGDAVLPPGVYAGFTGRFELVLHIDAASRYPADGQIQHVA